jgi:hypothetical protein
MKIFIIKIVILLFPVAILFLSCSQELIKSTIWEGKYRTININKDGDFSIYFLENNEIKSYLEILPNSNNRFYINLKGDYTYTENDTFKAKLKGYADLDGDGQQDLIKLKLDGTLNYYTGIGSGDSITDCDFTNSVDFSQEGNWKLERVGN